MCSSDLVQVAGSVRALLCADEPAKARFIEGHEALMTFAMTEYLINVVCDFCPVEEALLIAKPCARFTINNLCDALRQRGEACMELPPAERWEALEAVAKESLPQLQRQLKICNARRVRRAVGVQKGAAKLTPELLSQTLDMCVVRPGAHNPVAQVKVLEPSLSFAEIQCVMELWRAVSVHWLPKWLRDQQEAILEQRGSCRMLKASIQRIHICLMCTMTKRSTGLNRGCSLNCRTGALQCEECRHPMQPINMVGRVLRVHGNCHFLCPRCLRPTRYAGTLETCERCMPKPPPTERSACLVCQSKNAVQTREIVDVRALAIQQIPLCARHAKACVQSRRTVYDIQTLERDLYATRTTFN